MTKRFGWLTIGGALFGPAFIVPMGFWASNPGRFVDAPVAAALAFSVLSLGILVTRATGARNAEHLTAAQTAILVFWNWGSVPSQWFPNAVWEVIVAAMAILGAAWAGSRLRSFEWLPLVIGTTLGVAAASMAVTGWLGDHRSEGAALVQAPLEFATASPGGDLLILVVDGFTSPSVLRRDFDFDMSRTVEVLDRAGFNVPDSSHSNYTVTNFSVPSLLRLDYLAAPGNGREPSSLSPGDRRLLAGEQGLMAWMGAIGYHVTKFESGWEDDNCVTVDTCISPPRLTGITSWFLGQKTPGRPFANLRFTNPYPTTALSILEQLPSVVADAAANDRPDFIMAHVISPHGPFLLSGDCVINRTPDPILVTVGPEFLSDEIDSELRRGYLAQVECISGYLEELAGVLSTTDTTVLVTGDHGSDLRRQMFELPAAWSDDDLTERFGIFLATKTGAGCDVAPGSLINVARATVGCALDIELPRVEDRYHASSFVGGPDDVTERLRQLGG